MLVLSWLACTGPEPDLPVDPDAPLARFTVRDANTRGALCNDGSAGTYYYRRGAEPVWVVFLATGGSGGCDTVADCDDRWSDQPHTMSSDDRSRGPTETAVFDGLLSADPAQNPHLAGAHHVYAYPCTNDSWLGTQPASEKTGGWQFTGRDLALSIVEDLLDTHLESVGDAELLVLAGSNAAADGVRGLVSQIQGRVPDVPLQAVVDGRFLTDYRPAGWNVAAEVARVRARMSLHGVAPPQPCEDEHGPDANACFRFHSRLAYPLAPMFQLAPLKDPVVLGTLFGLDDPADLDDPEVQAYRDSVRTAARDLPAGHAAFVADVRGHKHMLVSDVLHRYPIEGLTTADALQSWFDGATVRLVE